MAHLEKVIHPARPAPVPAGVGRNVQALISARFYRSRRPSRLQIALGLVFTIVAFGPLGYVQVVGTSPI
jgi:hypothetical protein